MPFCLLYSSLRALWCFKCSSSSVFVSSESSFFHKTECIASIFFRLFLNEFRSLIMISKPLYSLDSIFCVRNILPLFSSSFTVIVGSNKLILWLKCLSFLFIFCFSLTSEINSTALTRTSSFALVGFSSKMELLLSLWNTLS